MREEGAARGAGDGAKSFRLHNAVVPARPLEPALYLVATPIGNLSDITLRALETLAGADVLACEDTRVTGKLMRHLGLSKPLWRYDDHAEARDRERLIESMRSRGRVVQAMLPGG